jgi:hypothetical protein
MNITMSMAWPIYKCRFYLLVPNHKTTLLPSSCHLPVNFLSDSNKFSWIIVKAVILPLWRNRVKKLKTQSRRDSETQRNFKTLSLCDFASLHMRRAFYVSLFCGKKEKESIQKRNPLCKIGENHLHTSSVSGPYQLH